MNPVAKSLLVISCLLPLFANAQESAPAAPPEEPSQQLYQTPSGQIDITPGLAIGARKTEYKKPTVVNTASQLVLAELVQAEYGINDMFSVATALGFIQASTTYDPNPTFAHEPRSSGMVDPNFYFNGRAPVGPVLLRYGANLNLSIEKAKLKSNRDSNVASGGTDLTPYLGFEYPLARRQVIGAKTSYKFHLSKAKLTDETVSPTADATLSGGESFDVGGFYEIRLSRVRLGWAVGMKTSKKTTEEANGLSREFDDSNTLAYLQFYSPVYVASNITILPEFDYSKYLTFDKSSRDSIDSWLISGSARFSF